MCRGRLRFAIVALACSCSDASTEPSPSTTDDGGACGSYDEHRSCVASAAVRGVDVLFVVDRSSRMGPAQSKLARAMPALVEALEQSFHDLPDVVGVRVAFTVAEDPLPACPDVAPAELHLASCREHLADFAITDGDDATASACLDVCTLDAITRVPAGRPDGDGPWIEWDRAGNNIGGVDVAAALACAAPQGITGCNFPAPIGASITALEQLEPWSRPIITVIVSDAADCTLMRDGDGIFDPDSNRTFWTNPDTNDPMPAICWNAGVTCTGSPDGYDTCTPADKDFAGEPTGWMRRVLTHAEATLSAPQVTLGIVGVPEGWQHGDAIPFADAEDPEIQREYGIGPGCIADDGSFGLPPVRVRAFVEANPYAPNGDTVLFSICAGDWAPTMQAIAQRARAQIRPNCVPMCVADLDDAAGLQNDCTLTLELPSDNSYALEVLPHCEGTLDDASVPVGASACWLPRVGEAMSAECSDEGWNLEMDVQWAGPIPLGVGMVMSCTYSEDRPVDCPSLP